MHVNSTSSANKRALQIKNKQGQLPFGDAHKELHFVLHKASLEEAGDCPLAPLLPPPTIVDLLPQSYRWLRFLPP